MRQRIHTNYETHLNSLQNFQQAQQIGFFSYELLFTVLRNE